MQWITSKLRRLVLAMAGMLGGAVAGVLVFLLLMFLRSRYGLPFGPYWIAGPMTLAAGAVCGAIFPQVFMWYFLCPLSWFLSDGDAGGHPSGSDSEDKKTFAANASYLIGLALYGAGFLFSIPAVFASGLALIGAFTTLVLRDARSRPRLQVDKVLARRAAKRLRAGAKP